MPNRKTRSISATAWLKATAPCASKLRLGLHMRPDYVPLLDQPSQRRLFLTHRRKDATRFRPLRCLRCGDGSMARRRLYRRGPAVCRRPIQGRGIDRYSSQGDLWSPGYFHVDVPRATRLRLEPPRQNLGNHSYRDPNAAFVTETATKPGRLIDSAHPSLRRGAASQLVLAADQFDSETRGRIVELTRARAAGDVFEPL